MATTKLYVTGMSCNSCIEKARAALNDVPGIVDAQFDLEQGICVLEGECDPQAACQALYEAGYPSVVKSS